MNGFDKVKFNGQEVGKVRLNGEVVWGNKPYVELEYIESTGTQWINTHKTIRHELQTNIKYAMTTGATNQCLFGAWVSSYGYRYIYWESKYYFTTGGTSQVGYVYAEPSGIRIVVFNNDTHNATIDDTVCTINYTTISTDDEIYLFCANRGSAAQFSQIKLYKFSMTSNVTNEVYLDLIPCALKETNDIGLWDLVSNTFFGNAGSGDFIAGPEI